MSRWQKAELFGPFGKMKGPSDLPSIPACYAIYLDGQLTYVGQSTNLSVRINAHKINLARFSNSIVSPWGRCGSLVVKYRPSLSYGDWAMVELRLIRRLKPSGNQIHVRRIAAGGAA